MSDIKTDKIQNLLLQPALSYAIKNFTQIHPHLNIHVTVHRDEDASIFHPPLQFAHDWLSSESIEERLWVDWLNRHSIENKIKN